MFVKEIHKKASVHVPASLTANQEFMGHAIPHDVSFKCCYDLYCCWIIDFLIKVFTWSVFSVNGYIVHWLTHHTLVLFNSVLNEWWNEKKKPEFLKTNTWSLVQNVCFISKQPINSSYFIGFSFKLKI